MHTRGEARRKTWQLIVLAALGALVLGLVAGCLAENDRPPGGVATTTDGGDSGDGTDGSGTDGTTALSFAADVEPILSDAGCLDCHGGADATSDCTPCHSGFTPSGVVEFDYSIVGKSSTTGSSGDIVEAASSDDSVLWWVITGDSRYKGVMATQMGISDLSSTEKTTIQDWIDGGAEP